MFCFCSLEVVIASATWSSLQGPGDCTGLCTSFLQHILPVRWSPSSCDWTGLLGMVNVACARSWGEAAVVGPSVTSTSSHQAFVVGVNTYRSLSPLAKCVQDANDMAELLEKSGYFVASLTDPTRAQFVTAFDRNCEGLAEARRVVVHFSGHGFAPNSESFLATTDSSRT
jgi:hypothetical protein